MGTMQFDAVIGKNGQITIPKASMVMNELLPGDTITVQIVNHFRPKVT